MRYSEILKETEDLEDVVRTDLAALLSMMKAKGATQFPLKKLLQSITVNGMQVDPSDNETVNQVIDILTGMGNLVDKVENGMVHVQYGEVPDYEPGEEQEKEDSEEVGKKATKQAQDSVKNKDKGKLDGKVDL